MTKLVSSLVRVAALLAVVGGGAYLASPAYARTVSIGGTHSRQEIKSKCDAAGGINVTGSGGNGYGCFNPNKQTMVGCNNGGVCTGYVPLKAHPTGKGPIGAPKTGMSHLR